MPRTVSLSLLFLCIFPEFAFSQEKVDPAMQRAGEMARQFYKQSNAPNGPIGPRGGGDSPDAITERFFTGAVADDLLGFSVASAGDVNGDGFADVIVGAPQNDAGGSNAGRAYIYFGGQIINSIADVILTGGAANDVFGRCVASAGDVNGDGYSDIIVAAPFDDNTAGVDAGSAYIYFGGAIMNNVPDVTLTGETAGDVFGLSVASAGDVNGDGYADVIVGAPQNDAGGTDMGRAYIYFGSASMNSVADVILGYGAAGDKFGWSVALAGDVNGDGFSDVTVGAPNNDAGGSNAGQMYIYFGGSSINTVVDVFVTGAAPNDFLGFATSGAGDVNGDGYDDVIVGAWGSDVAGTDGGRAYLYLGGASMNNVSDLTLTGHAAGDVFGVSVGGGGDVNGDGYNDVIIGAWGSDAGGADAGRAYVFFGGVQMDAIADVITTGATAGDNFGASVASAGDVNGDGYSDLIVGAYLNDAGGSNAGRAYLYLNSLTGTDIPDEVFTGAAASDNFGISVASAGDVNGDGYTDVIVGAQGAGATGRAYIFFGGPIMDNSPDVIMTGEATGNNFGRSVSTAGDVNGDGYNDVIVGAHGNNAGGFSAGRAYIYFGGATMDNTVDVVMTGEAGGDSFGWSVSTAGDVNGDGYNDVIVGAFGYSTNVGRAYIYFGGSTMNNTADVIMTGEATDNVFGTSVCTAGDVNGDGYADVIVGASGYSGNTGRAYIFFGGSSMNNTADVIMTGEGANDDFGISVCTAGDVNGDGYADVIVGADQASSLAGRAYIFFGGSTMNNTTDVIMTGEGTTDFFGISVSTAGDVNGDGYADVIVGAYAYSSITGRSYIYFGGSAMNNTADVIMTGEAASSGFGHSVSTAGDVNGDGYADVIVGADVYSSLAGRAYLYLSCSPPIIPRIASIRDVPFDQGGHVRLAWIRSGYDVRNIARVTSYKVERSYPPGFGGFQWEEIANIAAGQNPQYLYTASTPFDSIAGTSGTFFFRVTALTSNVNEYWRSNIMSGHSVDNLAPYPPANPLLSSISATKLRLHWNPDVVDPDVSGYVVYRSLANGFPLADSTRFASVADTSMIDSMFATNEDYYYRITTVDIHGNESLPTAQLYSPNALSSRASFKLLLEGPYNTGTLQMNKTLRTSGSLATHFGTIPIPSEAVDSVTVELRNAASSPTTLKCRPAWLLTDGTIRDFADTTKSYVEFDTLAGNYYLVLYHRNHLPIMTAAAQSLNGATPSAYDFTTSQGQAYGTNPMKLVGTKYCLYGGDVNHSAVVTASDANLIVEQLLTPGYNDRDVNLSGVVSSADVNVVYANLLQASQVPAPSLNPSLTSTKEEKDIPTAFALEQNYPNPFNPSTTIRYDLPVGSHVSVKIYDLLGREVAMLRNEFQNAGFKSVRWDASGIATGVYLCTLEVGDVVQTKKLILLR